MIVTYPNYFEQTQSIGLPGIIEYHGSITPQLKISGAYGTLYDRPNTHTRTFDRPKTLSRTTDN